MIAEKTNTAQIVQDAIQKSASKVSFISDEKILSAIRFLDEYGFPNNKVEDYKYCNLDLIIRKEFKQIKNEFNEVNKNLIQDYLLKDAYNIVLVNGVLNKDLSDSISEKGLGIGTLNEFNQKGNVEIGSFAKPDTDAFVALNTAYAESGIYIHLEKNNSLTKPINLINVSNAKSESFINTRSLVVVEENSK
ncbi:MAG: hypothetical protein AB7O73_16090, partial [Bacteroidia bacterium]